VGNLPMLRMIKPPAKSAMFPPDEFIGFGLQLAADLLKGR
jgi:hypothetical protein